MHSTFRIVIMLLTLPFIGAMGFHLIEGWGWFDSLYMSLITLTTVGYMEVHPLSEAGRAFVMVLLVLGLSVFIYSLAALGEVIVRTELYGWRGNRQMTRALEEIQHHFIICGAGRMGWALALELADQSLPFVIVERDETILDRCRDRGWLAVEGDATDDDILAEAGIARARGIAAVLSSDADNLYVVLSARLLRGDLQIIARSTDEASSAKMRKAGANRVISLYHTSAIKMAQLLVKPSLEDFFEVLSTRDLEVDLAELHVGKDSPWRDKTLSESGLSRAGVIVVGIRRADGSIVLPPSSSDKVAENDCLLVLGKSQSIARVSAGSL